MKNKFDSNAMSTALRKTNTEEDVKGVYAKFFSISYDTSERLDMYTPQVLFEFKYDKNFKTTHQLASILAQTLYYVHRLKYGITDKAIPFYLCMADKNEAVLTETHLWKNFYSENKGKYDWDLTPSNPDMQLVIDLEKSIILQNTHVYSALQETELSIFSEKLQLALKGTQVFGFGDKKIITEENFEEVFEYWNNIFGNSVRNGFKTSRYFIADIQEGRVVTDEKQGVVFFHVTDTDLKKKKIIFKDYNYFWSIYEKVTNVETIKGILAKIDRLTDEEMRRFFGEFFTPIRFAKKSLDYLAKTLGDNWWKSGEYRLWDMACGTGNLEYYLPSQALQYCYLSTLYMEDVEHLQRLYHGTNVTIFQYDYLNDDIGNVFADKNGFDFDYQWKMPKQLWNDLNNPKLKWIILINPPFATAQNASERKKQNGCC